MFRILRMLLNRPNEEDYNRHVEKYMHRTLPEEDATAGRHNQDEVDFNKNNPVYEKRIEKAKKNLLQNLSEEKKVDLLWKLHINESMEEQFDNINKRDEK